MFWYDRKAAVGLHIVNRRREASRAIEATTIPDVGAPLKATIGT